MRALSQAFFFLSCRCNFLRAATRGGVVVVISVICMHGLRCLSSEKVIFFSVSRMIASCIICIAMRRRKNGVFFVAIVIYSVTSAVLLLYNFRAPSSIMAQLLVAPLAFDSMIRFKESNMTRTSLSVSRLLKLECMQNG